MGGLKSRECTCDGCGAAPGRDANAARNTLAQARASRRRNACPFRRAGCQCADVENPRNPTYIVTMAGSMIDERFRCAAEDRAAQQASLGVKVRYEDIGERLMELRKEAWDRYGATALWHVPPDATYAAMSAVADGLRSDGDLQAAYLAAAILREIKARTGRAA